MTSAALDATAARAESAGPLLPSPPDELELDGATPLGGQGGSPRLVVPYGRQNVVVGPAALLLLRAAREGADTGEAASRLAAAGCLSPSGATLWTTDEVCASYARVLAQLPAAGRRGRRPGMWCVLPLVPERAVAAAAARAAVLFASRWFALALLPACGAILAELLERRSQLVGLRPGSLVAGYALFVLLAVVHELGHAAATARARATPRRIGIAMYLVWPSLWTDVSDSWRLPPGARLLVDAGGVYFQLLATGAVACVALAHPAAWLLVAVAFSVSSVVVTLNPFMRFDGYWALTDALQVSQLSSAARRALAETVRRRRAGTTGTNGWRRRLLVAYGLLAATVWLAFVVAVSLQLPAGLGHLVSTERHATWSRLSGDDLRLLLVAVELVVEGYVLARLGRSAVRFAALRLAPALRSRARTGGTLARVQDLRRQP